MENTIALPTQNTKSLPSLTENTLTRYLNFVALYFAQGIPEGMLLFGFPAWMAASGQSTGTIAAFAVAVGLPWSFKFVAAPLMDRYTYLPMGRKRPWVLLGQLGLMLSLVAMAYVPDPLHNPYTFMMAGFVVSAFGAMQDVATDGMAVDVIPIDQQAKANGLMWGSKMVGISASLAGASWVLNTYGYMTCMLTLAAIICITMLFPLCVTERAGEKLLPWTPGVTSPETRELQLTNWRTIFKSVYQVFTLRNSLILTLLLFLLQGSSNYLSTLLPIFTVKALGWTNIYYAQLYASAKLIGGISGMLLGGILIDKFGKKRMMQIYLILFIATTSIFTLTPSLWVHTSYVFGFMLAFNVIYTFCSIGVFAIAMQSCWKRVSASQFTLYMTISNMGRIALAALIGPVNAFFDWDMTIFGFALLIGVALIVMQFLNIDQQVESVAALERQQAIDDKA
jgi:MFS transporter, PAT family, beta-lactamase induction signal transducer AmpG